MLPFLQLLRLPTVFTAMGDIILGFVLTHGFLYGPMTRNVVDGEPTIGWHEPGQFVGLLLSSCCLYLSGMVFNDLFDRKQDALERPGRPIPSGRVSIQAATGLGVALMLSGLAAASMVGWVSLQVSLLLAVTVLAYDGVLKQTFVGPLAMGGCRFLNVLLGASAQPNIIQALSQPQFAVAMGLGIYIVGVTLFARTEALTSNALKLRFAQVVINTGFAILLTLVLLTPIQSPKEVPLVMFLVIAFTVNRRASEAVYDPSPIRVQGGTKIMLLSLLMIHATLIFWWLNTPEGASFAVGHALSVAFLIAPAMLLSRSIPMT